MERTIEKQQWQVAEIQLSYKSHVKASERPQVFTTLSASDLLRENWEEDQIELLEQFKVMLLNRANRVLGIIPISSGGITGTVADPKLIFAAALKAAACSIILAHNHPSGNRMPSQEDKKLTHKLKAGAQLLDMKVLDHIILTKESYYSMADEGDL